VEEEDAEQQTGVKPVRTTPPNDADVGPGRSLIGADSPLVRAVGHVRATVLAKLLVAFVGIVLLLVILGVLGLRVIGESNDRIDRLGNLQLRAAAYRQLQVEGAYVQQLLHLRAGDCALACKFGSSPPLTSRAARVAVDEVIVAVLSGLTRATDETLLGFPPPAGEKRTLALIKQDYAQLSLVMTQITGLDRLSLIANPGDELLRGDAKPLADDLKELGDDLKARTEAETHDQIDSNRRAFAASQTLLIAVALTSILVALVLGYVLSWSIVGPIRRIQSRLVAIASGDFSGHVAVSNRDELGALASNVNLMNDELRRLYKELADLNETLETRVHVQIDELEHLGRLRRFLSPQLADLVVSGGDDSLLESHRREITVVFCDLRGFTAFSETAEPEEVMAVLHEFHTELGQLIFQFGGTLERFAGDALMMFFNDPFPSPDPPLEAVQMALAMQERIAELRIGWRKRGHDLGLGIGIAVGYATLGRIGFEGRFDYGAVGSVVNLAARLCAEALGGQILLADRAYLAVEGKVAAQALAPFTLKGFHLPVQAYLVTGSRADIGIAGSS
jgi:class 3 adenylate cyclase/HAMP domain-containing protein